MSRRRRYFLLGVVATVVLLSAVLWASPQVLILLREGYPAHILGSSANYAAVKGRAADVERGVLRPMSPRLSELFGSSDGNAIFVLQGGKLGLEHYAAGYGAATRFNSYSMAKSLVGALALKAVAEGRIADLDQTIGELLPSSAGSGAAKVTVRQALDMTSGINFEPTPAKQMSGVGEKPFEAVPYNPFGPLARLHALGLEAVLPGLAVSAADVATFRYQNVNTALLGAVLEEVYDLPLPELLSEKLWQPSGASDASWRQYPVSGKTTPYCCLFATAGDWALVGRYLMLNGGGAGRFLPDELWRYWIGADIPDDARGSGVYRTQMRYDILDRAGEPLAGPFAYFLGQGGQVVYLKPSDDLVVVRFGGGIQLLHSTLYESVK